MVRFGVLRLLAILFFGIALPWALFRLSRAVGPALTVVVAVALGLAYGVMKADHPWTGDGLGANLTLLAICAAVAGVYTGVSVAVAGAIAKRL